MGGVEAVSMTVSRLLSFTVVFKSLQRELAHQNAGVEKRAWISLTN